MSRKRMVMLTFSAGLAIVSMTELFFYQDAVFTEGVLQALKLAGLGLLIYFLAVKFKTAKKSAFEAGELQIGSRISVGRGLYIFTLKARNKYFLLSQNASSVNVIANLDGEEAAAEKNEEVKLTEKEKDSIPFLKVAGMCALLLAVLSGGAFAADSSEMIIKTGNSSFISMFIALTVLAVSPAIILMMTPFTRIVISLSLLRHAIGLPMIPSNQIIAGLSLFMTFFIMRPQVEELKLKSVDPYLKGQISYRRAFENASPVIRKFMYDNVRKNDLENFVKMSKIENAKEIPLSVLIPAFITSELKTAFQIGVLIFIPFILIDMVVSSVLMSMGMIMIPPAMISLPIKLLIFILTDGWNLVLGGLYRSFNL